MKGNKKIKKKNTQEYGIWTDQARRQGEGEEEGEGAWAQAKAIQHVEILPGAGFPHHVLSLVAF